jgi:RND family efflux transporter MFP subunit
MNATTSESKHTKADDLKPVAEPPPVRWWSRLLRILVAVLIVCAGLAGAAYLKKTAPRSKKRPPARRAPVVQVQEVQPVRHRVVLNVMGTVVPARQVVLKSRVAGQVIYVHPEFSEGGFLKKGALVIQLDAADYRLVLAQRKSDLIDSQHALKLELGRQEVARREWEILSRNRQGDAIDTGTPLALRESHLEKARADVAAAEAAMEKAMLDLERTKIFAPFNAIVRSKSVDIGSQVTPQLPLAELVGTDAYWVQASVPVDRLTWIKIPQRAGQAGSPARIACASGHRMQGTVLRLMGDLTKQGRMARLLVEVRDPLHLKGGDRKNPPLLIGEYVRVAIQGPLLENVFVLPRAALRDNQTVWLLNGEGRLEIRRVSPVWRDAHSVVLKGGLAAGERLVMSDLATPVAGMQLRLDTNVAPAGGGKQPARQQGKGAGRRG